MMLSSKGLYNWRDTSAAPSPSPAGPLPPRAGSPRKSSHGSESDSQRSLCRRSSQVQFQDYESLSEGEDTSEFELGIPDDTPLLVNLDSFPLPPEVASRRPSPMPVRLSVEEQQLDDLRAEQAGEELLLLWDKRDWRLSVSSSELPCLPPSSVTSPKYPGVIDLGDESDEGLMAEAKVEDRPRSPDVGQLVENATPRIRRRRGRPLDPFESSSDELDLHTPLAESAVKHGIISPNSSLLSPTHASPLPRRRPKLTPRNSSAALRTGEAFTSGLGWSGSEDEQEMEDRAAFSAAVRMATPTGTPRFRLGVASSSHRSPPKCPLPLSPTLLSPTVPSFSRRAIPRRPSPGLSLCIPPPSKSTHRLSIQSHTSSVSTASSSRMLATPPADPWGEFEIIRDPWDEPASPPVRKLSRRVTSGVPTATSRIPSISRKTSLAAMRIPNSPTNDLPPLSPTGIPSPRRRSLFKPPDESRRKAWSALLE